MYVDRAQSHISYHQIEEPGESGWTLLPQPSLASAVREPRGTERPLLEQRTQTTRVPSIPIFS